MLRHNNSKTWTPDPRSCLLVSIFLKDIIGNQLFIRNPGRFGLGCFGQFWGWVVSALVGGLFRLIFGVSPFRPKSIEFNKV